MFTRQIASVFLCASAVLFASCSSHTASSDISTSVSESVTASVSQTPSAGATPSSSPSPVADVETPSATVEPEPATLAPSAAEDKNLTVEGAIAQTGVSCGKVTDDKALIMAAAPAGLSCETAQEVMTEAIERNVGSETNVFGFICHGRDEATAVLDGRSVTCTSGETRLEAMETYTLAGTPVQSTADYPTQFGNIQVYGFRANGVECYFGKVSGVSCWRPSVINSLPYEVASLSSSTGFKIEAPADLQDGESVTAQMRDLQPGEVITTNGMSCNNDGTYTSCRIGDYWFKINATELKSS